MIVRTVIITMLAALSAGAGSETQKAAVPPSAVDLVVVPSADTPLVSLRLMFHAGSIFDPKGKEGLSSLTALMIGSSGTAKRTYTELVEALYPTATSIDVFTDREVVVFATEVHRDMLDQVTPLMLEAVLEPGFREEDLTRNREQLLAFLTTTLRSANDELLGLEMIQQVVFAGHAYGHAAAGTVSGLKSITMNDVRNFYREHFTQSQLILGVGGGFPASYPISLVERLGRLPRGSGASKPLPPATPVNGRHFTLVEKNTDSTGIHFGYPLPITRKDADFYPLMVANSYLGEHRTFHGRLMQELRGKRGLNYGDYSYIEYWDNPPGTSNPPPNHPRRAQYFAVWIRPVVPDNAVFALRAAIHEVNRLAERGLTQEEFELTRDFLISYSKLWARSLASRLAFHMDSRFYDMPYFIDHVEQQLRKLSVDDVNRAARRYLQTENFKAVVITGDAAKLREKLMADEPSAISYANPVGEDVTAADKTIVKVPLSPKDVVVLPVQQTFESAPRPAPPRP